MRKYTIAAAALIVCLTAFSFALAGTREYVPVAKTPDVETAYIVKSSKNDQKYVLDVDPIEWFEGEEAIKPFLEREGDSGLDGPLDGYYIINDEETLKSLPIAQDAIVLMQIYNRTGNINEADIVWDEQITVEKFIEIINTEDEMALKNFPYHLTIEDGEVIRIVQQYVP